MKNHLLIPFIAIFYFFNFSLVLAQAPNLGSCTNYILFTSVGAVTNSGTGFLTKLTGNVGTNSAPTITGFGNVNGQMHYTSDPSSAQCQADLTIAYNQLDTTTPGYFPSNIIGNGDTLNAGVYSVTSSTITLAGDLILDGKGNPNAVFIFKLQGTFSSGTNAKVKLINGTLACNVFWKVEGAVNLATGTTMRGTVIANNAAISLGTGDTLEGRLLSTNGAITVSQLTGHIPIGCGSPYLSGPSAPALLSIACYATFTSTGSNTNYGISTINGDVGTNSGLTIGYNPLFVSGTIHPVPDASTAAATADLNNIYSYLSGLAPGNIELLFPAQFGHNLELTPHTYLMNSAVSFTDTVILNAQGNANAVFVILVNGAFSTSVNSMVLLTNGAQAKNIYWRINGAMTINNNSIFNGIVVCAGSIDVYTGSLVNGRVLSTGGALNISAANIIIPKTKIIYPALSKFICSGDSAKLILGFTGKNYLYQWRKGNVNLIDTGNISGSQTDTLKIYPITRLDSAGNYNLIITDICNQKDTSDFYNLTINVAPIITSEPKNLLSCILDTLTMTVKATGSHLIYQWRKGNINLINDIKFSGVDKDMLTVYGFNISDTASNYNVIVYGSCSPSDTSLFTSLKQISAPQILTEPTNKFKCLGDSVVFHVLVSDTNLLYQWNRGNIALINSAKISGVNTSTLTIRTVLDSDTAYNYNVIVTEKCLLKDTSIYASLALSQKPNITLDPINQTVCEKSLANFMVIATGTNLIYQWKKGNTNLTNDSHILGANSSSLSIDSTKFSDTASNYSLLIQGECNTSILSKNVSLKVNAIPVAILFSNSPVCFGSEIRLGSNEIPGSTYRWTGPNSFISTTSQLSIQAANSDHAGIYSMVITSNNCSSIPAKIEVVTKYCLPGVDTFFIPEGFSPNGDGVNDVFVIRGLSDFQNNSIEIFNRWGVKIYGSSPYLNNWNGTCITGISVGGDKLPVGIYFYILNLGNNTPALKGTIYLNN